MEAPGVEETRLGEARQPEEARLGEPRYPRFAWAAGWKPVLVFVAAVTAARLLYLLFACPYTLIEDEAHYWEWSRQLGLSYYSKGPGIAWLIAGGTALLGDTQQGVRVFAPICSAIAAIALAGLGLAIGRDRRLGLLTAVCFNLTPAYQFTSLIMTIDMPYVACWSVAAWAGWHAIEKKQGWAWIALGAALGVGVLFKYTALLLVVGLVVYAVMRRGEKYKHPSPALEDSGTPSAGAEGDEWASGGGVGVARHSTGREEVEQEALTPALSRKAGRGDSEHAQEDLSMPPRSAGGRGIAPEPAPPVKKGKTASNVGYMLIGVLTFLGTISPIFIWNAQHGWPTVHHLLGHLGVRGGDQPVAPTGGGWDYSPAWTLEYIAAQFGLVGPMLVLMIMAAVRGWRQRRERSAESTKDRRDGERDRGTLFVFACGGPIVVFYLIVSFITEGEGNWAIAGYTTLMIAAAGLVLEVMDQRRAGARKSPPQRVWAAAVVVGLFMGLGMLRIDWLKALPVVGEKIPTGRLMHADARAAEFAELAKQLAERTGREPIYMAQHYGRASQMAFYLPGHPRVYCTSKLMGGRGSQYDMWPETDLMNPETHAKLVGRPAVMNGGDAYQWERCFEAVESAGQLPSESKRGRMTYFGVGYRGFGKE